MTDRPIDLDGHRTSQEQNNSELRRNTVNRDGASGAHPKTSDIDLDVALSVQPARTWVEAMEKTMFLLGRYAATIEANDPRIQKLIQRAESDLARLRKSEDTRS